MLLAPPPPAELPAEALLARLRARRAALALHGADNGGPTPEAAMAWLHPRLGGALHAGVAPYLEIEAMHCLLLALRHRLAGTSVPPGLLRQPWLAAKLPVLLEQPGEARAVVTRLEAWLSPAYPFVAGLTAGYLDQGPGRLEQQLAGGILGQSLGRACVPVVAMTVRFLIDLRNLLAVLRHWRWHLRVAPGLLAGGELAPAILTRAWAAGDTATIGRLTTQLAGADRADLEPRAAERQLLGGLTRRLRRAGRDPLGSGVILDYLWRCKVATCNRTLRQAAGEEDGLLAVALL